VLRSRANKKYPGLGKDLDYNDARLRLGGWKEVDKMLEVGRSDAVKESMRHQALRQRSSGKGGAACRYAEVCAENTLETVHLDVGLGSDTFLHDESGNLLTLVTLELDNLAEFLVVNNGTVACEFLLESLQELLLVILFGESLKSSKRLTTVPLLDTDVNVVLGLLLLDRLGGSL